MMWSQPLGPDEARWLPFMCKTGKHSSIPLQDEENSALRPLQS